MNLTPANWEKSEVTNNKNFVATGMRLYSAGSVWCVVTEVRGDKIKVRFEDDTTGEFDEWFDMNDLQIGWEFSNRDREFIEAIS